MIIESKAKAYEALDEFDETVTAAADRLNIEVVTLEYLRYYDESQVARLMIAIPDTMTDRQRWLLKLALDSQDYGA